jgi:S-adenosylmethionine hydrolase
MAIITLTSDYGLKDPYAAIVKGVLYGERDNLVICDISHDLPPGDIVETSFVVKHSYASFPAATVHLILTAENISSQRWFVMQMDAHFFVASDNGVLTMIAADRKPRNLVFHQIKIGEQRSTQFPGRDFLARAAAHLSAGGAASLLGPQIAYEELIKGSSLRGIVDLQRKLVHGHIIFIDNYGNLITNIDSKHLQEVLKSKSIEIKLPRNRSLKRIATSYHDIAQDGVLALINSLGLLEIAFRDAQSKEINGANSLLGLGMFDTITISYT